MTPYRNILLLGDPELRKTAAFAQATALARVSGARLHLGVFDQRGALAALGLQSSRALERGREGLLREQRQRAEERVAELRADGIEASASVSWAHPLIDELLERIDTLRPDLVIKDIDVGQGLLQLLYTPLDWRLLQVCRAPLLLVAGKPSGAVLPRRVLAAVDPLRDGATVDAAILRTASALADQAGAELHLAHVCDAYFELVVQTSAYAPLESMAALAAIETRHRQAFDALAETYGIAPPRRHFLRGMPAPSLAEFATQHDIDITVLGTTRDLGEERPAIGHTGRQLLRLSASSVLAVKDTGATVVPLGKTRVAIGDR